MGKTDEPDWNELHRIAREQQLQQRAEAQRAAARGDIQGEIVAQTRSDQAGKIAEQAWAEANPKKGCVVVGGGVVGLGALIATVVGNDVEASPAVPATPTPTIYSLVPTTPPQPSRLSITPDPKDTPFWRTGHLPQMEQPIGSRATRTR